MRTFLLVLCGVDSSVSCRVWYLCASALTRESQPLVQLHTGGGARSGRCVRSAYRV